MPVTGGCIVCLPEVSLRAAIAPIVPFEMNRDLAQEPTAAADDLPTPNSAASDQILTGDPSKKVVTPTDDLPDFEPLTPELVEDEAIRGDFMLRWASVLIAMLLGWTVIDGTDILVQIRSGEYMAAHGVLPPRTDVFSSTAGERPWINLSWVNDLTWASIWRAGGDSLLSVTAAVLAAITFWILGRISLPGVSTWWGSVCAVIAAIACFPFLTAGTDIVTLLGVALMLAWIHRVPDDDHPRSLLALAVLMVAWTNLDPRAWLGVALLIAWTVGEAVQSRKSSAYDSSLTLKSLLTSVGVATACLLVNPFHIHAITSALTQYTLEYPALRQFGNSRSPFRFTWLPMSSVDFWTSLNYFSGAGLLLMVVALTTLLISFRQVRCSHWLLFVLANGLAIANAHELPAASLINCVLATLNAQAWYLKNFRQEYSVELSELLFSRGGRALTVLACFGLCFAAVGGHLMGADGRRVGMGFSQDLTNQISSLSEVVSDSLDDRPFNFVLSQGDQLIWVGQRPFADTRVRLFAKSPSILEELQQARLALRLSREGMPGTGDRATWQKIFDRYDITHVLPRLSPPSPDYVTFRDLLASTDWRLTRLGATAASFYRTDLRDDTALAEYVARHDQSNIVDHVFRSPLEKAEVTQFRTANPRPPSFYDQVMFLRSTPIANDLQMMQHRAAMIESGTLTIDRVLALAYDALRHAHAGFHDSPQESQAYQTQARLYQIVDEVERGILASDSVQFSDSLRYFQVISSYHLALQCDPFDSFAHYGLFEVYLAHNRIDLALEHLLAFQGLTRSLTRVSRDSPDFNSAQEQGYAVLSELTDAVDRIREQKQTQVQTPDADRAAIVQSLLEVGCPGLALEVIEEDLTMTAGNPALQLLYGRLLLEVGRIEEANDQIQGLESIAVSSNLTEWPATAAFAAVSEGNLQRALSVLADEYKRLAEATASLLTAVSPLGPPMPMLTRDLSPDWPASLATGVQWQLQGARAFLEQIDPQLALNELRSAQIAMEAGKNQQAIDLFEQLLKRNPQTPLRALVGVYLKLLTGEDIGPRPESTTIEEADLFAPPPVVDTPESTEPATSEPVAPTEKPAEVPATKPTDEPEKPPVR